MHRCLPLSRCCIVVLLALLPVALRAEKLVVARSSVVGDYAAQRRADGRLQPQSYVFMPGRFLSGNTRDRSLERFPFRALAGRLAQDLLRQDFHPAAKLSQADLLLVIHWGATAGRNRDLVALTAGFDTLANVSRDTDELREQLDAAVLAGDADKVSEVNGRLDQLASTAQLEQQDLLRSERNVGGADTAALLGFTAELNREDGTLADRELRHTLVELTREECYFVVVIAYDARTLVASKRLERVWSLRVSINTAGVNFPEAVDRISQVAGEHFGLPQERIAFTYPPPRKGEGSVRLDDLVILGAANPK